MDEIEFPPLELDIILCIRRDHCNTFEQGGKLMEVGFRKFNLEMASKMDRDRK